MKFTKRIEQILSEGYAPITSKTRYPRSLKLSEKFIRVFKEEFKRLCTAEHILDENGDVVSEKKKNPKQILEQMKKALHFHAR